MIENDRLMPTSSRSSLAERWRRRSTEKLRMNQFLASSFEFKETLTQRPPWLALVNHLLLQPGRYFPGIGATS